MSGHAGLVGQYSFRSPPVGTDYNAFRVPIGLTLQASPSDNLNIYLGLEYAYNNYPETAVLLGNSSTNTNDGEGEYSRMPFSNAVNGTTPYGQPTDTPTLSLAYFTYQTEVGMLRAGRMPRNWGLGIWYNDDWSPQGALPSTSDAINFSTDFGLFDVGAYLELYSAGVNGTSSGLNATAYTLEVRLKTDPADVPSSGFTREIGVAFSKFDNGSSNTELNIFDLYGKFYISKFFIGGEVLYPSGSTQSPDYQSLGGAPECTVLTPGIESYQTCNSQDISALAALIDMKYQFDSVNGSSLAATEKSQYLLGTADRQTTNIVEMLFGYASGGSNQFDAADSVSQGANEIRAIFMNANINPSFLMFNNTLPPVNGMPMGAITNTTFISTDYTFESPSLGAIGPRILWAQLNATNSNFNSSNTLCSATPQLDPTSGVNRLCVGESKDLGVEIDAHYRYTTRDRVTFGTDIGYWFVGDAWLVYGQERPPATYGVRVLVGTEF
jgi:hypothetical protein